MQHALQVYDEPLATFASDMEPGPVITVPVMQQGRQALEDISQVSSACNSIASLCAADHLAAEAVMRMRGGRVLTI